MNVPVQDSGRIIIENGAIVTPDQVLTESTLVVEDGRIARITSGDCNLPGQRWNAGGQLVMPGFIDLHSDALEKYIEPRARSVFPLTTAILEFDKTLPACGITTMFHCVAYVYGDSHRRSLRTNEMGDRILDRLHELSPWLRTHGKAHVRFDLLNLDAVPRIREQAKAGRISLLSFMDHTPGQGQYRDVELYRRKMVSDYNLAAATVDAEITRRTAAQEALVEEPLRALAAECSACRIPIASHDDDGPVKVAWARRLNASISEFPVCEEALQAAADSGMWTLFGAPNVLRGASQSGNMSAAEIMRDNRGDILASDYAPMSLLHAVFKMTKSHTIALPAALRWVTLNPAKAAGIDHETGSLEEGKIADIIMVSSRGPAPQITTTFTAGCLSYAARLPFRQKEAAMAAV